VAHLSQRTHDDPQRRQGEFTTLLVLAAPLMMIGLLVSTLQALRHGEASMLWRVYLGVAPPCVAGIALSRPVALIILQAIDQMSSGGANTVHNEATLAKNLLTWRLRHPAFALFLLGGAVVVGTWLLWV